MSWGYSNPHIGTPGRVRHAGNSSPSGLPLGRFLKQLKRAAGLKCPEQPEAFAPCRNQLPPLPPLKTSLPPVPVGAEFFNGDNDLQAFFRFAPTAPTKKEREPEGCAAKGTPRPCLVRVDSAALAGKLSGRTWGVIHPAPPVGSSWPCPCAGDSIRVPRLLRGVP